MARCAQFLIGGGIVRTNTDRRICARYWRGDVIGSLQSRWQKQIRIKRRVLVRMRELDRDRANQQCQMQRMRIDDRMPNHISHCREELCRTAIHEPGIGSSQPSTDIIHTVAMNWSVKGCLFFRPTCASICFWI